MQKTLPLYLGPSVIGSVVIDGYDGHLDISAKTYANINGICRAYVKSRNSTLLIGVLAPDGSAFSAKRHFSKATLSGIGISFDEISYAYAICKEDASQNHEGYKYETSFSEALIKNKIALTLSKSSGAKLFCSEHGIKIAVPLFTGLPFPRPDVLCLMYPEKIDGNLFGVISVSSDGKFIPLSRRT